MRSVLLLLLASLFLSGCGESPPPNYPFVEGVIKDFYFSQGIRGGSYSTIVFEDGRAITFVGISASSPIKSMPVKIYYSGDSIQSIVDVKREDRPARKKEPVPDVR